MVAEEEVISGQMGYILETKLTGFADKQDVECETENSQKWHQGFWPSN